MVFFSFSLLEFIVEKYVVSFDIFWVRIIVIGNVYFLILSF